MLLESFLWQTLLIDDGEGVRSTIMSDKRKARPKDDSYFSIMRQKKKRKLIIIISIVAIVLVIALISVVMFSVHSKNDNRFGPLGSVMSSGSLYCKTQWNED